MFSNSLILLFIIGLVPIPLIVYSAIRALNIRRALAVPLYRNQALGVALASLSLIGFIFTWDLYNGLNLSSNLYTSLELVFGFIIPSFVAFYWIDASVRTARRSDPLLRDVLHWRMARIILWVWIGGIDLVFAGSVIYSTALEAVRGQLNTPSSPPGVILMLLLLSPLFMVPIVGLLVLPRAAKKSGDKRFGKHLKWFGLFIFLVLGAIFAIFTPFGFSGFLGSLQFQLEVAIPQIVAGYCLYKSVRWLVPLNRFPLEEAKQE